MGIRYYAYAFDADRAQQLLGLFALHRADAGVGIQAAGTQADQRRGVGHAAHDCTLAQPVFQAGAADAGCDGSDVRFDAGPVDAAAAFAGFVAVAGAAAVCRHQSL